MKKKQIITLAVVIVAAVIGILLLWPTKREKEPEIYLSVATELREIVRLTTMEGERVVPIKYSNKGIGAFGIGHYRIRISFDIEQMQQMIQGDTIYLVLPDPEVQILEHEEYGFTIYDVWGENIATRLMGPKLSVTDENEMKRRAMNQLKRDIQNDGSIERAKTEAIELLHKLFDMIPGTVIILDDPSMAPQEATRIPLDQPTTTLIQTR